LNGIADDLLAISLSGSPFLRWRGTVCGVMDAFTGVAARGPTYCKRSNSFVTVFVRLPSRKRCSKRRRV